jgi:ribosomal protein S18 acetylase RimI-like enzyme
MCPARFLPIDLDRHFQRCVEFLCDAFVCSYGNSDAFDAIGGAQGYRAGLEHMLATFPEGAVHVWRGDRIVGQLEMGIQPASGLGVVNLFYLASEERGRGLGAELHSHAIEVFRRHRVQTVRLSVSPTNVRALRYYAKHGWQDLGPRPDRPYVHSMELAISEQ